MKIKGNSGKIILENELGQYVVVDVTEDSICVDRTNAGARNFSEDYSGEEFSIGKTARLAKGDINMELLFDVSYLEVFADGGLEVASIAVYPDVAYRQGRLEGDRRAEMYLLN